MYYVFFTNELCIKKNELSLFGRSYEKKPYLLKDYKRAVLNNGKTYLKEDSGSSVRGFIVELAAEQLWLLDQYMDVPLSRRKSIRIEYDNESMDLYLYISSRQTESLTRPDRSVTDGNIAAFQAKKNLNSLAFCDLHLVYPCSFDHCDASIVSGIMQEGSNGTNPYREETPEELEGYEVSEYFICKLNENNNYEFNDPFITSIGRIPLGTVHCSFAYDGREFEEYGFAYISKHTITEIGTFSIVFPCIANPVILQLYSFCENVLKIMEDGTSYEVTQWLKAKNIEIFGYPKAIIFSYDSQVSKKEILKCLAFEMDPIADICSKTLNDWANDNIAQYNLAEVYASDRCLIEIRKDNQPDLMLRLKSQAVELFFIEVLLFQEAAISRVCSKVSNYLNYVSRNVDCKNSFEILSGLSKEMANAIMFIDHKRLRYPSVRLSSKEIAERFGLPDELDKYYKYREILDDMISLNSNEQDKVESSLMNFLLLMLTMIQVIPTIQTFINIIMTGKIRLKDGVSLLLSLTTCTLFYILYRVFKWKTIRKLSKNRNERKKIYDK